nr:MAG TPA: MAEBL protein [Caudoviricetes sp.]
MEKRLTADLNVVANSNLEIQLLDGDLNIIQKLDDEPNDVGGLTSAELKAKFDESGNIIKKYINETLIPAVLTDDATEESRKQAEAARVAAEQGRVTAEEGRVSAESGRVSAEQARDSAETARSGAESTRQSQEAARQTAETKRNSAETARVQSEQGRSTAETARTNAETARREAETSRDTAESNRAVAEQGRVSGESTRVQNETQRVSAEQARSKAESSRVSAENAREAAEKARADETAGIVASATAQANAAAGSASQAAGSEQAAQNAANTADSAASSASQSAASASSSANDAAGSAAAAANGAAIVAGINKTAQSWAVGGTGTREGEDTNNAKYWAEQAEAVVGGDFATKVEAQGYVTTHNQSVDAHADIRKALNGKEASGTAAAAVTAHNKDSAAHADIREAVSKAGKPFIIEGTLTFTDGTGTVSGITTTKDEILAAIEAGKGVNLRLSWDNDGDPICDNLAYCSRKTYHELDMEMFRFGCTVGDSCIGVALVYTESGLQTIYGKMEVISCSDDAPSAPGTASAGTSSDAARADHVHPSERPKATLVTLTAAGWDTSTKKQTVTVSGVLADTSKQVIWVAFASEAALDAYMDAGIVPVAQGANTVTFRADKAPTTDIAVTVLMQEVSA